MGQAGLLHDGVEPDAVEALLPEQARGRFHNPLSALSCLLACHAHCGRIPTTDIAPPLGWTVTIRRGASSIAPAQYIARTHWRARRLDGRSCERRCRRRA